MCWCNFVVVSIFILSSWAVYISGEELSVRLYDWIYKNQTGFFVAGPLAIIVIIVIAAKKLYNNINN